MAGRTYAFAEAGVEALGGRIALHSPPGTGTTLEIHIPLRQESLLT